MMRFPSTLTVTRRVIRDTTGTPPFGRQSHETDGVDALPMIDVGSHVGVCPRRAQVYLRCGTKQKPLSSLNTSVAPLFLSSATCITANARRLGRRVAPAHAEAFDSSSPYALVVWSKSLDYKITDWWRVTTDLRESSGDKGQAGTAAAWWLIRRIHALYSSLPTAPSITEPQAAKPGARYRQQA